MGWGAGATGTAMNPEGRLLLLRPFDVRLYLLAVLISYGIGLADDVRQSIVVMLRVRARRFLGKDVAC